MMLQCIQNLLHDLCSLYNKLSNIVDIIYLAILPASAEWEDGELLPASFCFEHHLNKNSSPCVYADVIVANDRAPHVEVNINFNKKYEYISIKIFYLIFLNRRTSQIFEVTDVLCPIEETKLEQLRYYLIIYMSGAKVRLSSVTL